MPAEEESESLADMPKLSNGDPDVVKALYSDTGIYPSEDGSKDPFNVTKINQPGKNSNETKNFTQ